jgi:hypothetical protein
MMIENTSRKTFDKYISNSKYTEHISKENLEIFTDLFGFFASYARKTPHTKTKFFHGGFYDPCFEIHVTRLYDDIGKIINQATAAIKEHSAIIPYYELTVPSSILRIVAGKHYMVFEANFYNGIRMDASGKNNNLSFTGKSKGFAWIMHFGDNDVSFYRELVTKGQKFGKERYIPLTFLDVASRTDTNKPSDHMWDNTDIIRNAMKIVFSYLAKRGPGNVFRDIAADFKHDQLWIPAPINEFAGCNTKKEALEKVLKQKLPPACNSKSIQHTYYAAKLTRNIKDENEHMKLYLASEEKVSDHCRACRRPITENTKEFLYRYIASTTGHEDNGNDYVPDTHMLRDYVDLAIALKDINLKRKTIAGYRKEHDRLYLLYIKKKEKKLDFKLKKDDVRRKLLPADRYEIIDTRAGLIMEGDRMGHCVGSYADKVKSGRCAIYKATYQGKPYTIEICKTGTKAKYSVRQVQGRFNRGTPPTELVSQTKALLKESVAAL